MPDRTGHPKGRPWRGIRAIATVGMTMVIMSAEDFFQQGLVKEKRGDMRGAIADFSQVIGLQPTFIAAYLHRGMTRTRLGDHRGALEDEISPHSAPALMQRGIIQARLGEPAAALAGSGCNPGTAP